jgi:hypothetical protein
MPNVTSKKKPKSKASSKAKRKPEPKAKPKPKAKPAKSPSAKVLSKSMAAKYPAAVLIDERIRDLADWRGAMLAHMRALILEADPEIVEEWKWGVPVWSRNGIVCTGEAYKQVVKLTFARGASVDDPAHLFNSSLEGNARRAIDIREGEQVDAAAFKSLIKAAVARNGEPANKR